MAAKLFGNNPKTAHKQKEQTGPLVNKSKMLPPHLCSAVMVVSLLGGGGWIVVSGLGMCDLSPSWDGRTKSLIFPHKLPPVADDRFVKIS